MQLLVDRVDSPLGPLIVVSDGDSLRALEFDDHSDRLNRLLKAHYGVYTLNERSDPGGFAGRVRAYFEGDITALDTIPVATGGTAFQRKVWAGLRTIPAGTTLGYGQLAARVGHPGASRAVGTANGSNPIGIVVPCHRVIGAGGSLSGYAGGVERKRWLLSHEGAAGIGDRRKSGVAVGRPTCQSCSSSPTVPAPVPATRSSRP